MLSIDVVPIPTDEAVREVENRLLGVETNITNWQRRQNSNNNFSAVVPYDMELQRKESKLSLFPTETLADVFDRKMTDVDISPVDVKRVISDLEKERKALGDQISQFTNDSNDVTQSMIKTVQKYMGELGDSEAEKMTWRYLFTSNLKELSGAVLHKTVFSFRLAYIIEIEKALGIKLPILLDSPKGKEVDDINIGKMMQILQRDFPDNQIIIASIYHYVQNEHVITLERQLLDQTIN